MFQLPSFNTFVNGAARRGATPPIIYFWEKSKRGERGSGVRFNRVGIICRRGLPSNLRHITTNGFGALRKRLVGAHFLFAGAPTDPTAVKVRNWGPRVIFVQSSFLRPSLGVVKLLF